MQAHCFRCGFSDELTRVVDDFDEYTFNECPSCGERSLATIELLLDELNDLYLKEMWTVPHSTDEDSYETY